MSHDAEVSVGVVVVAFNSEDVIRDCIQSLLSSSHRNLRIVVVDNASTDGTMKVLHDLDAGPSGVTVLAAEERLKRVTREASDCPDVMVLRSAVNLGYAGGVNLGLDFLMAQDCDLYWVLNPDCRVFPETASAFVAKAGDVPGFGLMGGRVIYVSPENRIQTDGGRVNPRSGMCSNIHLFADAGSTPHPNDEDLQYIPGACIVASRTYLQTVGKMEDDYFLYYEEVDWAFRRGELSLVHADKARVLHHAGTAIGSPVVGKEQGSSFSNYFNYRNRIRFVRRFFPRNLAYAYLYSAAKVVKLALQGHFVEADGAARGLLGLRPPKSVRSRLTPEAYRLATR